MTHYRMLDRAPAVVITSNRNELKVYQDGAVYLNNGDNFELRFFNPLKEKVGVEIMFNGIKKGDALLVLNPGQDIVLDRFLDEQRKMLFDTYHVDGNNKQAVEAIEQNGLITFNFFKETYSYSRDDEVNVKYKFPPKPYNYNKKNKNSRTYGSGISRGINISAGPKGMNGPSGYPGVDGTLGINNVFYSSTVTMDGMNLSNVTNTSSMDQDYWVPSSEGTPKIDELETGRIEKGDISNQNLNTVNADFKTESFHTISYKMLPYSAKNRTVNEVRQYCSCGYRLRKQSWKYCPKCGEKNN